MMTHQRAYNRNDLTWVPCICDIASLVAEDKHDDDEEGQKNKSVVMDFIASTERLSRSNHIIDFDGLSVKNFKQYGPILFDHNYGTLPVGRALRVQKNPETRQTIIRVKFDTDDPFAMQLAKKYQTGFMKAVSVGVMVIECRDLTEEDLGKGASKTDLDSVRFGSRLTKTDLMELSLVSIPANVDAKKIVDQAVKAGTITEDEGLEWMHESEGTEHRPVTITINGCESIDQTKLAAAIKESLREAEFPTVVEHSPDDKETLQDIREDFRDLKAELSQLTKTLSDGIQRNGLNAPLSRHYSEAVLKEEKPSIDPFKELVDEMTQQRKELTHERD